MVTSNINLMQTFFPRESGLLSSPSAFAGGASAVSNPFQNLLGLGGSSAVAGNSGSDAQTMQLMGAMFSMLLNLVIELCCDEEEPVTAATTPATTPTTTTTTGAKTINNITPATVGPLTSAADLQAEIKKFLAANPGADTSEVGKTALAAYLNKRFNNVNNSFAVRGSDLFYVIGTSNLLVAANGNAAPRAA